MTHIRAPRNPELIAAQIVRSITRGHYAPGTTLPQEEDMCDTFGVARNTIREALRILETQGVVEVRPGRHGGPVVLPRNVDSIVSGLRIYLGHDGALFKELLEARIAVESSLAQLAAHNKADVATLDAVAQEMQDPECELDRFVELNRVFHSHIAEASANSVLQAFYLTIRTIQGTSVAAYYSREDRKDVISEHRAILKAIRASNATSAGNAMSLHLRNFLAFMEAHHPEVLSKRLEPLLLANTDLE